MEKSTVKCLGIPDLEEFMRKVRSFAENLLLLVLLWVVS
jgi:hypothetical protein